MKNKLILSLLSLFVLVSCNGSKENEKTWEEEQKKIMQDHLYGEILPYIDLGEEATLEYDDVEDEVQIIGAEDSIITQEELKAYANLYSLENGWYDNKSKYVDVPENAYIFEKKVKTNDGNRFVNVQFYATDTSKEVANEGRFVLFAYDPYVGMYDWPSEFFKSYTEIAGSEVQIPKFPADYYQRIGEYPNLLCYTSDSDAEAAYKKILQQNNFTVLEEKIDDASYAIDPKNLYAVGYYYYEDLKALEIFFDIQIPQVPSDKWPKDGLNEAFKNYGQTYFEVPSYEFTGAKYLGYEDEYNSTYFYYDSPELINYIIEVRGATETTFNTYLSSLESASWVKKGVDEDYGTTIYEKSKDENYHYKIEVFLDTENSKAYIFVFLFPQKTPVNQWPSCDVKKALDDGYNNITDVVPAITNDKITGFIFEEETVSYYPTVKLLCAKDDVDTVFNAYVTLLTSSSYQSYDKTSEDKDDYISPNKQIIVTLGKGSNVVYVSFYHAPYTSWPKKFVDAQKSAHQYSDDLPSLEGNNLTYEYVVYSDTSRYPKGYKIDVTLSNEDETQSVQSLMEQYGNTLKTAQFSESTRDDLYLKDEKIYTSHSNQFDVTLYISSTNTLSILVTPAPVASE